jgi:hypothetical protein
VATNNLAKLASAVEWQTIADGGYDTAVAALRLSRFSAPSDLVALVYEPSLCVVAQCAKEVLLADETYRLDPAQSLLVSVDLPVAARVVEASSARPYRLFPESESEGHDSTPGSRTQRLHSGYPYRRYRHHCCGLDSGGCPSAPSSANSSALACWRRADFRANSSGQRKQQLVAFINILLHNGTICCMMH